MYVHTCVYKLNLFVVCCSAAFKGAFTFPAQSYIDIFYLCQNIWQVFCITCKSWNIDMLHDLHAHILANQHLSRLGITLPTCNKCCCCDADGLYHASSGWNLFATGLGNRCTSAAWRTALWFMVVIVLVVYVMMRQWYFRPAIDGTPSFNLPTWRNHKDCPGIESFGSWAPYKVGYPTSCLVGVKCHWPDRKSVV